MNRVSPVWRFPAAVCTGLRRPPGDSHAIALPDEVSGLDGVGLDPGKLARYRRVTGHDAGETVPATYPHILGFGLALRVITARGFPFPATGLLHISNVITQYRELDVADTVNLRVWAADVRSHRAGTAFDIVTVAESDGDTVWREHSTYLHRRPGPRTPSGEELEDLGPVSRRWRLDSGTGRRYAAVSGDFNPIHLHRLGAKLFGLRGHIAHGMWTLARGLGALAAELPAPPLRVSAEFSKPLFLPAEDVTLHTGHDGDSLRFRVASQEGTVRHLAAEVAPAGH